MHEVVVYQRYLTHYRVEFFERLRRQLQKKNIFLRIIVGSPHKSELVRRDFAVLPWIETVPTYYFFGLCFSPVFRRCRSADIVVIPCQLKILSIYALILMRYVGFFKGKVAFWGHGRNFQATRSLEIVEFIRRRISLSVDWWFGYTKISVDYLVSFGFDKARITNLNNSSVDYIDVGSVSYSGNSAIFVGSLTRNKRLDFLFEAADRIASVVADFELIIVGDGPLRGEVLDFAANRRWVKFIGPLFGEAKSAQILKCKVMLNPGLVGLGILDSFLYRVPLFTTDCGIHSPEISYLRNGVNGVMTENNLDAFCQSVVSYFNNESSLQKMRSFCDQSARFYTLDNMVDSFCDGLIAAVLPPE